MIPEQLPEESQKAYAAFAEYCKLGPERSLAKLRQKSGTISVSKRSLEFWSIKYRWQERIIEYDTEMNRIEHEATEKALKARATVWATRQLQQRDKAWKRTEDLLAFAFKRLKEVKAVTLSDIVKTVQACESIQRLCLNLPTEKSEVTGPDNAPIMAIQSAAPVVVVMETNERFDATSN